MLLAALLAVGRSFAVEEANGARDGLRLSGLDGGAVFLGKAAAIAVELFLLEVVLGVGVVVLYDVSLHGVLVLAVPRRWPRPSDWRRPVRSTACSPPARACARRSCRCSCSRRSRR